MSAAAAKAASWRPHRYVPPIEEHRVSGQPGLVSFVHWRLRLDRPAPDVGDCLASSPDGSPWLLYIWEPLATKAPSPPKAAPWCCYINTVIFYHSPYIPAIGKSHWRQRDGSIRSGTLGFEEWGQVQSRLTWDDIVEFRGEHFRCGGGAVHWQRRRWWMVHYCRRQQP